MINVRAIVNRRMKEQEITTYELAKRLRGRVSLQTVYNFVKHDQAINSKTLGYVLSALGLEIREKTR